MLRLAKGKKLKATAVSPIGSRNMNAGSSRNLANIMRTDHATFIREFSAILIPMLSAPLAGGVANSKIFANVFDVCPPPGSAGARAVS